MIYIMSERAIFFHLKKGVLFIVLLLVFVSPAMAQSVISVDGNNYLLIEGKLYNMDKKGRATNFIAKIYDPEQMANAYETRNNIKYRIVGDNAWPVIYELEDGFENANSIHDLINISRGWTSLTLQSPKAPNIADYVSLRNNILQNKSNFLDNRVEPTDQIARSGAQSLMVKSVPPSKKMPLTKSSLDTELLYFSEGDNFWFSGWFFIQSGTPTSLLDIESSFFSKGAGMRLMVSPDYITRLELKWANKPTYRQIRDKQIRLPLSQWFNLKVHFYFSANNDGIARLWLNDKLIIFGKGQTLPTSDAILDRLQLGITANPPNSESIIFIDDIKFSHQKFFDL